MLIWVPEDDPSDFMRTVPERDQIKKKSLLQNIKMLELPQDHLGVMTDMI